MFIVLFVLWIILNGRITLEIAIFGAVICGALYLFLYKFMEYSPKRELVIVKCTGKILKYVVFLVVEVIKAALAVSKLVLEFDREPEPVLVYDPDAGGMVESGKYQFDSKGALRALELIGKHLGMYQDKLKLDAKLDTGQLGKVLEQLGAPDG